MSAAFRIAKRICKYLGLLVLSVLLVVSASVPLARLEMQVDLLEPDNSQALAVDNVHLITMSDERMLEDQQLLIRDGLIEDIRPAGSPVAAGYRLIDGGGGHILPGLFDMHTHVMDRKYLALHLAYGVTSVRNMGGYPMHLRWKQEIEEGEWLGSNLFTATPTMNGKKNSNPFAHKVVEDPGDARERIRRYHEAGFDFVKVYTRLSVEVYKAIIDEAGNLDFPVAGHVPYAVVAEDYSLGIPMVSLEHTEEIYQGPLDYSYDEEDVEAIVQQLREMRATLTPTLLIFDHLTQIARHKQAFVDSLELQYLNPFMRFAEAKGSVSRWLSADDDLRDSLKERNAFFQRLTLALHEAGVNMVTGSDSGVLYAIPGQATHDEIALLKQAGLPTDAVLEMATIKAARVLRVDDRLGTIEIGKVADLVVTQENPLVELGSLREPVAVIRNGQWLDQSTLRVLRESATHPSSMYYTFGRLLEFVFYD